MAADPQKNVLVIGADEAHQPLSPLFDSSINQDTPLAEGGGSFCLSRKREGAACLVRIPLYRQWTNGKDIDALIQSLAEGEAPAGEYALVLAGIPAAVRETGEAQLASFLQKSGCNAPVLRYREFTGEFSSASAVAAAMAASIMVAGRVPGNLAGGRDISLTDGPGAILVLGLGSYLTAMEFQRP